MGQMEDETGSTFVSQAVESSCPGLVSVNPDHRRMPTMSCLVDGSEQPSEGIPSQRTSLDGDIYGRFWCRLGSSPTRSLCSGSLGRESIRDPIQCPRDQGDLTSTSGIRESHPRFLSEDQDRQCLSCGICQGPGRNEEQDPSQRDNTNHAVGSNSSSRPYCSTHSGCSEFMGGLPEPSPFTEGRMGAEAEGFSLDNIYLGLPADRSDGNRSECQASGLLFQSPLSRSSSTGCLLPELEGSICLCVSSNTGNTKSITEDYEYENGSDSNSPRLAQEALVSALETPINCGSVANPTLQGPPTSGFSETSQSSEFQASGLEIERRILKEYGCSDSVIETLVRARKSNTNSKYHKVWRTFSSWAMSKLLDPLTPSVAVILEFLQEGLQKGLSLSTLKGQVSALSAVLGKRWSKEPLIERFFQGVKRIRPPTRPLFPSWDLPLVLRALSAEPFEPLEQISLWLLTLKTFFLVAITSARRISELQALSVDPPYTIFHEKKVHLRPVLNFLPKVVSKFHINEPIVLPSFENLTASQEKDLSLDVKRCLEIYIKRTESFRKSRMLFIIPAGKRKGEQAAKSTLSSWIVKAISRSYKEQGNSLPKGARAHSARGVAASWAAEAGASSEDICRAATWVTPNTFIRHYRLDVMSFSQAQFGQSILLSATSV
ncbi:uncharacterized protein LOC121397925 isoform X1 [Xenopus laevis]|uniref:Uncharacterized protein LOC121397925 isoform X1 n=1 Tax=Xenopus laevis TaxID=8355 RepID=A0A8J1LST9_XENLA|nr:uncharacterized protein LOC121397925 isoform X1 [Xenopus laevis]